MQTEVSSSTAPVTDTSRRPLSPITVQLLGRRFKSLERLELVGSRR